MPAIQWVILLTDYYSETKQFYIDKLGFVVEKEIDGEEYCQFKLQNCTFGLYGREGYSKAVGTEYMGKAGAAIYSLPDCLDIDADYQRLLSLGVTFIKPPVTQPWGQRTAYFTDPDGHIWELQQWLK